MGNRCAVVVLDKNGDYKGFINSWNGGLDSIQAIVDVAKYRGFSFEKLLELNKKHFKEAEEDHQLINGSIFNFKDSMEFFQKTSPSDNGVYIINSLGNIIYKYGGYHIYNNLDITNTYNAVMEEELCENIVPKEKSALELHLIEQAFAKLNEILEEKMKKNGLDIEQTDYGFLDERIKQNKKSELFKSYINTQTKLETLKKEVLECDLSLCFVAPSQKIIADLDFKQARKCSNIYIEEIQGQQIGLNVSITPPSFDELLKLL